MPIQFQLHQATKNICTSMALAAFIDGSTGIATKKWERLSIGIVFGVFSVVIALSLALESKIETSHLEGRLFLRYTRPERATTIHTVFGMVIMGASAMGILDMVQGMHASAADQSFLGIGLIGVSYASVLHLYLNYEVNRRFLIMPSRASALPTSGSTSLPRPSTTAVVLQVSEALAPRPGV